ncbi:DUF2255 family protein [Streptacidiphilus griseoplanus]|uniref:DUF2255 family protein n=1 Tax=Peterkaempfera griseoplana TaxID=66896 RepID=UPI0006E40284|nr:DUF2255 family protein [Peterkaempfera griseoplana]
MTTAWTPAERTLFGTAPSLVLSAGDGGHPGVEVGMVVVQGDLHVRAQRGVGSRWFLAAREYGRGRIEVGEFGRDVLLETDGDWDADALDAAYRAKYGAAATLLAGPDSRAATIRIRPDLSGPLAPPSPHA